jgi:hypothetical protein
MKKLRPQFTLSHFLGASAKGQSLVETALFLPIMIIMLLGIVEVSTLLINQNRVTTAGRIAAGYGAANYKGDNWNELAPAMGIVALNSITETLDLSPDLWDIWAVQAVIKDGAFEQFRAVHVFGNQQIVSQTDWNSGVENRVRQELLQAGDGVELVAAIPYHNSATFLNLPIWQWTGFKTISGLTAMRVDKPAPFAGCAVLPIAVRVNQPSLYPSNWPNGVRHPADQGGDQTFYPTGNPGDRFDNVHSSNAPWSWPTYFNTGTAPNLSANYFHNNVPGINFSNARPGYLYRAREEDGNTPGGFGWLCWDGNCSQQDTEDSLAYLPLPPGNFMDMYPGGAADMNQLTTPDGSPSGNGNGALEVGEWIKIGQGNVQNLADNILRDYIKPGRPVTLLVYDMAGGSGNEKLFRVANYVTVKIVGTGLTGSDKFMIFEFVRWSTECLDLAN